MAHYIKPHLKKSSIVRTVAVVASRVLLSIWVLGGFGAVGGAALQGYLLLPRLDHGPVVGRPVVATAVPLACGMCRSVWDSKRACSFPTKYIIDFSTATWYNLHLRPKMYKYPTPISHSLAKFTTTVLFTYTSRFGDLYLLMLTVRLLNFVRN